MPGIPRNDGGASCDFWDYTGDGGRIVDLFEEGVIRVARRSGISVCKGGLEDVPQGLEHVGDLGGLSAAVVDCIVSAINNI